MFMPSAIMKCFVYLYPTCLNAVLVLFLDLFFLCFIFQMGFLGSCIIVGIMGISWAKGYMSMINMQYQLKCVCSANMFVKIDVLHFKLNFAEEKCFRRCPFLHCLQFNDIFTSMCKLQCRAQWNLSYNLIYFFFFGRNQTS